MNVRASVDVKPRVWPEVQELLPRLSKDEREALSTSIAEDGGVHHPIVVLPDGRIIDGHHRWEISGGTAPVTVLDVSEAHALKLALVLNIARRHLSKEQIAEGRRWQKEKYDELRAERRTEQEAADAVGVSQATASAWEQKGHIIGTDNVSTDLRYSVPKSAQKVIYERHTEGESANDLADDYKITPRHVRRVVAKVEKAEEERRQAQEAVTTSTTRPVIAQANWDEWLDRQPSCDLLLTDPPYSTDVADIDKFARWLPKALKKVNPTGRAYVFVGAYPAELRAYLNVSEPTSILVWTYRNTLGPKPLMGYKLNWQAILYFENKGAAPLDCPVMTEQFSVQDISAPDGRFGDRYHAWEKPLELAERFVRHSTKPSDVVFDPFAGTGTFLIAAARQGRAALGCDNDPAMIEIAAERGCQVAR